jgi:hypothetical protein
LLIDFVFKSSALLILFKSNFFANINFVWFEASFGINFLGLNSMNWLFSYFGKSYGVTEVNIFLFVPEIRFGEGSVVGIRYSFWKRAYSIHFLFSWFVWLGVFMTRMPVWLNYLIWLSQPDFWEDYLLKSIGSRWHKSLLITCLTFFLLLLK